MKTDVADLAELFGRGMAGGGSIAKRLLDNNCDPLALRPYRGADGCDYIDYVVNTDENGVAQYAPKRIVTNDATLLYDEWKKIDAAVREIARPRLSVWGDLMASGLRYDLPNAMGYSVLQYQNASDTGPAALNFEGLSKTNRDREVYDLNSLPLPIVHKDWSFSLRDIEMSRNGQRPLELDENSDGNAEVHGIGRTTHPRGVRYVPIQRRSDLRSDELYPPDHR